MLRRVSGKNSRISTEKYTSGEIKRGPTGKKDADVAVITSLVGNELKQALLNQGLDPFEQIFSLKVGAGLAVGKAAALIRPGLVNGTAFDHPIRRLEDAGAVIQDLEGISVLDIATAHLAV